MDEQSFGSVVNWSIFFPGLGKLEYASLINSTR